MAFLVSLLAVASIAIGLVGVVSPDAMKSVVTRFSTKAGYRTAIALRLVLAVALWRVAPTSRTPAALQALGVLSGLSSVALLLLGFARYRTILAWWSGLSSATVRLWSSAPAVLGFFLLWSAR
jgi:hypothetical protein